MTRVFIVDDHPMVIAGLNTLLKELPGIQVAGSCGHAVDTIPFLRKNQVDIILMDINLPDINGIELCKKVKKEFPSVRVIAISTFSDRGYITRMIDSGASGYLIKSASAAEIATALHTVKEGRLYLSLSMEQLLQTGSSMAGAIPALTRREKEILQLIADGLTNNQIAEQLFISQLTVDSHRKNLLTKFGVNNTAMLIRYAVENGLV